MEKDADATDERAEKNVAKETTQEIVSKNETLSSGDRVESSVSVQSVRAFAVY